MASYLLVEIARAIKSHDANASIWVVESERVDHWYLEIKIQLKDELSHSVWEVDAWDPRIIDISTRPDGSIKNRASLKYGYSAKRIWRIEADNISFKKSKLTHPHFFETIKKPIAGVPSRASTPERMILDKHKHLHSDFTLEDAYEKKKRDPQGQIHSLQRVSFWQRSPEQPHSTEEKSYSSQKRF